MSLSVFSGSYQAVNFLKFGEKAAKKEKTDNGEKTYSFKAESRSNGYTSTPTAPLSEKPDGRYSLANPTRPNVPMGLLVNLVNYLAQEYPLVRFNLIFQAPSTEISVKKNRFRPEVEKKATYPVHLKTSLDVDTYDSKTQRKQVNDKLTSILNAWGVSVQEDTIESLQAQVRNKDSKTD